MVSIAEARQKIEELRTEIESLKMDYHTLRELETVLNRTLFALEQATGSKEIKQAINNIQRLISMVRMAQLSIHALEIASGPIGWAVAISSIAATGVYISASAASQYEVDAH